MSDKGRVIIKELCLSFTGVTRSKRVSRFRNLRLKKIRVPYKNKNILTRFVSFQTFRDLCKVRRKGGLVSRLILRI